MAIDFHMAQALSRVPFWRRYRITYDQFSTAGLTNSITLFSLPPGYMIHACKLKHSEVFDGPSISSYTISVGISGTVAKYLAAFNCHNAVAATTFGLSTSTMIGSENHDAAVDILASATAIGANLSTATTGIAEVFVLMSKAK
jgi:hypothetical protein